MADWQHKQKPMKWDKSRKYIFCLLGVFLACGISFAEPLPSSFDLRDINGHSYIGPVRDQGGKWGQENGVKENGVKSTVDPCSKLIRVKSRLDPSDSWTVRPSVNMTDKTISCTWVPDMTGSLTAGHSAQPWE